MRRHLIEAMTPWLGYDAASVLAPGWFTMVALGAVAGAALVVRRARARGLDVRVALRALIAGYAVAIAAGIAGPILALMLEQLAAGQPVRVRWAGMTSWFGIAGGVVAMVIVVRRDGVRVAAFLDCVALPAGVTLAVARVGCFLAGCDYGTVSSAPWAMRFPAGSPAWAAHVDAGLVPASRAASLPVHPTQLYEVALGVALVAVAAAVARWRRAARMPGAEIVAVGLAYAVGRFAIEALRADLSRGVSFGLSTGQWMSAAMIAALAVVAARVARGRAVHVAGAAFVLALAAPARADDAAAPARPRAFDVSGMVASSAAINRRDDQVPQLGGFTLSGTLAVAPGLGVGIDLGVLGNDVAVHRDLILSGEYRRAVSPDVTVGGRLGIGFTTVDFADEAFASVLASGARAGVTVQWWFQDQWALAVWPFTLDLTGHPEIGGTIATYQFRVGVSFGRRP